MSSAKATPVNHLSIQPSNRWGRHAQGDWVSTCGVAFLFMFCPIFAGFAIFVCANYQGSIAAAIYDAWYHITTQHQFMELTWPQLTLRGGFIYGMWMILQLVLSVIVPGPQEHGQLTPAGHLLKYRINGFRCWWMSHIIVLMGSILGIWKLSTLYDEWFNIFLYANIMGYALTIFAYLKAYLFPSHPHDCKYSGSFLYDLFMGVELNPRIGNWFDFKLFFNGRPGIGAWTLINIAFMHKQYELYGYVTNSMILVNILQALYVLDFFWNEGWYLRTIDIAHDHFGFYLAWGDSVWLPFTYTIQGYYLVNNPVILPTWWAITLLVAGFSGYLIFRSVNDQKDRFRAKKGDCIIWGKHASFIEATFHCGATTHSSYLLTSGFWGISRHFNYFGDLILSFTFCAACGAHHILPYFYIIYMTILLIHRCYRDETRCSMKYGKSWELYCQQVPWRILPGVF